nr:hypothetical protein Itr_chr05CG12690 [Ipomoea trifida]
MPEKSPTTNAIHCQASTPGCPAHQRQRTREKVKTGRMLSRAAALPRRVVVAAGTDRRKQRGGKEEGSSRTSTTATPELRNLKQRPLTKLPSARWKTKKTGGAGDSPWSLLTVAVAVAVAVGSSPLLASIRTGDGSCLAAERRTVTIVRSRSISPSLSVEARSPTKSNEELRQQLPLSAISYERSPTASLDELRRQPPLVDDVQNRGATCEAAPASVFPQQQGADCTFLSVFPAMSDERQ